MKTRSVTDVARNFSAVLDQIERDQVLYRTLDDETANALASAITTERKRRRGRVSELRDNGASDFRRRATGLSPVAECRMTRRK